MAKPEGQIILPYFNPNPMQSIYSHEELEKDTLRSIKRVNAGEYEGQLLGGCDGFSDGRGMRVPGVSFSSEQMTCTMRGLDISRHDLYLDITSTMPGRVCINNWNPEHNRQLLEKLPELSERCFSDDEPAMRESKEEMLRRTLEARMHPDFWDKVVDGLISGGIGFIGPPAIVVGVFGTLIGGYLAHRRNIKMQRTYEALERRAKELERKLRDRGPDDPDDPPPTGGGGKVPAASEASETAAESSAAEMAGLTALFVGALTILGTHGHKIVGGMRSIGTGLAVGIEGAAALPFMFYDPQLMPPEYRQGGDEA